MFAPLLAGLLAGCTDPDASAATQYVGDVQPLMIENSRLAEGILQMAAQVYNREVPSEGLATRWTGEIVPLAQHLATQAEGTAVPSEWKDDHTSLVVIWSDRAAGYHELGEALLLADLERWGQGRAAVVSFIRREEQWFRGVNDRLRAYDLEIEQYP